MYNRCNVCIMLPRFVTPYVIIDVVVVPGGSAKGIE